MASPVSCRGVQPFGVADLGQQLQRPQAGGLAEDAGAVVQQVLEGIGEAFVQEGPRRMGSGGLLLETG